MKENLQIANIHTTTLNPLVLSFRRSFLTTPYLNRFCALQLVNKQTFLWWSTSWYSANNDIFYVHICSRSNMQGPRWKFKVKGTFFLCARTMFDSYFLYVGRRGKLPKSLCAESSTAPIITRPLYMWMHVSGVTVLEFHGVVIEIQ